MEVNEVVSSALTGVALGAIIGFYLIGIMVTRLIMLDSDNFSTNELAAIAVFWPVALTVIIVKGIVSLIKRVFEKS